MSNTILTGVLTAHWIAAWCVCDATESVHCACGQWFGGETRYAARDAWIAHVTTLVTAETTAELDRQFPPHEPVGAPRRTYLATGGFPIPPATALPGGRTR